MLVLWGLLLFLAGAFGRLRVLVVGGGPAGLASAVAIFDACVGLCNVQVWEARSGAPARNVWFDVAGTKGLLGRSCLKREKTRLAVGIERCVFEESSR
jgi:flavin-dependent dehydrogenase